MEEQQHLEQGLREQCRLLEQQIKRGRAYEGPVTAHLRSLCPAVLEVYDWVTKHKWTGYQKKARPGRGDRRRLQDLAAAMKLCCDLMEQA